MNVRMSILDLPNELLSEIFSNIEEKDLLSLLHTQSHLKSLALPRLYQLIARSHEGYELIHCAKHGMKDCVQYILGLNVEVDITDDVDDRSALSYAAEQGHTAVVQLLLDHGVDVHHKTEDGMTALHYAAFEGHGNIVRLLTAWGADPNLMAEDGIDQTTGTPLSEAARGGHAEVASMLLDLGAYVNALDDTGMTPLHYAGRAGWGIAIRSSDRCMLPAIQNQPLFHGEEEGPGPGWYLDWVYADMHYYTKIFVKTHFECTVPRNYLATVKLLIAHGANCHHATADRYGHGHWSPLLSAAWGGDEEIVQFLIDSGADVNSTSHHHLASSPLHAAAYRGHEAVVKILISQGAQLNMNNAGTCPLHVATSNGQRGVVTMLVAHGADVNARDRQGHTALDLAEQNGQAEMIKLLTRLTVQGRENELARV